MLYRLETRKNLDLANPKAIWCGEINGGEASISEVLRGSLWTKGIRYATYRGALLVKNWTRGEEPVW